jgi:hypothetical protein
MFDTIPISMFFVSEIEAVTTTGVFQRVRTVDEIGGVVYVVFLAEFGNERLSKNAVRGRIKPCMKHFVRLWIDCGVQPVLFIIESNHGFIDRNVIRVLIGRWL